MGDTNRPAPDNESEKPVHLPQSQPGRESGQHPAAPESGVGTPNPEGIDPKNADVVAAIAGINEETTDQLGEQLAKVINVDFQQRRKNGSRPANVLPLKGLAKPKPRPKAVKPAKPRPPKVDGLTPIPTPMVQRIAGGKRTAVSTAALEAETQYSKRTRRERLLQIVGILDEKLSGCEARPFTGVEAAAAARSLLALASNEELVSQKRSTDNTYFNEVATILLTLWPRNYQLYLDDRRVTDMMRVISEGGPHARILGLIKNWLENRIS